MDAFRVEVLGPNHDRSEFSCGNGPLDRYFRQRVTQDERRRVTACYVAVGASGTKIAGYYTLAASGVPLADMPDALIKRLPRYPLVPVARLGRPAVDQAYRGRKLGGALLWDVVARALRSEIAVFALIVDAKDDRAEAFYLHHGFVAFESAEAIRAAADRGNSGYEVRTGNPWRQSPRPSVGKPGSQKSWNPSFTPFRHSVVRRGKE